MLLSLKIYFSPNLQEALSAIVSAPHPCIGFKQLMMRSAPVFPPNVQISFLPSLSEMSKQLDFCEQLACCFVNFCFFFLALQVLQAQDKIQIFLGMTKCCTLGHWKCLQLQKSQYFSNSPPLVGCRNNCPAFFLEQCVLFINLWCLYFPAVFVRFIHVVKQIHLLCHFWTSALKGIFKSLFFS